MADTLIRLDRVGVNGTGGVILDDVSLDVAAGRIVTIVGPNGAGKSTLVKTALGLQRPDRGKVTRQPGLVVGYVPQKLAIPAQLPLPVGRFLSMARPGAITAANLAASLDRVGLGADLMDRQVIHLSGGELQRALLARAMLRRPHLLVLDEPAAGVDVAGQADLYDLIAGFARQDGAGVLMVSHDLHVVMAATDEVVCLNRHVCCAGHPDSISRHPDYLALFGARAAASLALYTHTHDHSHGHDGCVHPPAPSAGASYHG